MRNLSMAVNALAEASDKLFKTALSCKAIGRILNDSDTLPRIVELKREKARLLRQQLILTETLELKRALSKSHAPTNTNSTSVNSENNGVADLIDEVLAVQTKYHQDVLLLERLQTGTVLLEQAFQTRPVKEILSNTSSSFHTLVEEQTSVCSRILQEIDKIHCLQKEIDIVQREKVILNISAQRLNLEGTSVQQKEGPLLMDKWRKAVDHCTLLRQILLCLISSSGVDWSCDTELLQLVLTLGEPTFGKPQSGDAL